MCCDFLYIGLDLYDLGSGLPILDRIWLIRERMFVNVVVLDWIFVIWDRIILFP